MIDALAQENMYGRDPDAKVETTEEEDSDSSSDIWLNLCYTHS